MLGASEKVAYNFKTLVLLLFAQVPLKCQILVQADIFEPMDTLSFI